MNNKRGLSAIIITLIIVGLSLVAVGIVWGVVSNLLKSSEEQSTSQYDTLFLNMKVEKVVSEQDGISVQISRGSGGGTISGVAITISDGENTKVIKREVAGFEPLEHKTFSITSSEMENLVFVKSVSVSPLIQKNVGNVLDKLEFSNKEILKNIGAVSWWKLDGNARDEIGNNHGTIFGNVQFVEGKHGQGANFDGATGYINTSNTNNLSEEFTLFAWVKPSSNIGTAGQRFTVMSTYPPGWIFDLGEETNGEFYRFHSGTGGSTRTYYPPSKLISLEWTNFVVTRDSLNNFNMYLDGNSVTTSTSFSSVIPSTRNVLIGRRTEGLFFNGTLDELFIFNRALTSEQVKVLYEMDLTN